MDNLITPRVSWWTVTLVLPSNATAVLSSSSPCRSLTHTHSADGEGKTRTLALAWTAIRVSGSGGAAIDVTANWTLRANAYTAELSAFTIVPSAESTSAVALWSLEFSVGLPVRALHFPLSHSFSHKNLKSPCAEQLATTDTLYVPFLYGLAFDDPGHTLYRWGSHSLNSSIRVAHCW
jgi:hypothetical protein